MTADPCPPLLVPPDLTARLSRLAAAGYPLEACGLLVGRGGSALTEVVEVTSARNLESERPRERYLLDPRDFLDAHQAARIRGLDIVGVWHSHPDRDARPSRRDREGAWEGYSYLIVPTTADGAGRPRSWRLVDGRFVEQSLAVAEG